mmetsp:Transcript_29241/g.45965  ORF Transcript_29241/g.45965 Transcript_29241/m.45965 type:complete len:354 (-) Transcript_29241:13-1074(-)
MMTLRRRKTITVAAVIIYGHTTAIFLNPVQVLADRDAHLQEKYFLNQLKNKKKGGFPFGRRKKRDNDPAVKYQRQQLRLSDSAYLSIAVLLACLTVLWIFRVSSIEMGIMLIGCLCSYVSDFTGSFAQPRSNDTSRRKQDRNNLSSRRKKGMANNTRSSRQKNSFNDNQSISPSVLEIIDMDTIVVDDAPSSPGVISTVFGSMTRARKKFMSSSKQKDTPHNQRMDRSSSSRIQKSHRDKSSLRLRASSKQTSVGRDEELGDDDKSNVSLPGLQNFVEDDECSDNGTAFAINLPTRHSPKRAGSTPSKNQTDSPLQKKLSCELEDEKKHRSHNHRNSHRHSSRRHKKHRTPAA